jgi:hypothetical protein
MMKGVHTPRVALWQLLAFSLLLLLCALPARASTVLEMSFQEVVDHAELVFEGRVRSVEARRDAEGMIHTWVDFEVLEVLKGDHADSTFTLRFLGGTVGTQRLEVTDLQLPQVGEAGFYFVESLTRSQVNPLVGWSQGHFLIEPRADGQPGVLTAHHEPVLGVSAAEQAPVTAAMNTFSKGVAKGVVVQESLSAMAVSGPMHVDDFKRSVRALVLQP